MIKSCKNCKNKCCQTGPGPHVEVESEEYLENFGTAEAYNTKCVELTDCGKCNAWGTNSLPSACRVYVCQNREYSDDELETINHVTEQEDFPCPNCGSVVYLYFEEKEDLCECEACRYKWYWSHERED